MLFDVAPRFCLSCLPQRAEADRPGRLARSDCRLRGVHTKARAVSRASMLQCWVASLALGGCQYVSGVVNLDIRSADAAPPAMTGPRTSGDAGRSVEPQTSDEVDGSRDPDPLGEPDPSEEPGPSEEPDPLGEPDGSTERPSVQRDAGPDVAVGGPWDCVGASLRDPGTGDYEVAKTLYEVNTNKAVPNATVRACLSTDATCAHAIAEVFTSDGAFRLTVPMNFQGYLQVHPEDPFMPAIVQMTMPIGSMRRAPDIVLFRKADLANLGGVMGVKIDDSAGHAFFSVADCSGEPARNVSLTVSSKDAGAYAQYYLADNFIPTTERMYTGQPGGGGFVNLAPGLATFQAVRVDTKAGLATVVAPIESGVTTFFEIQPR